MFMVFYSMTCGHVSDDMFFLAAGFNMSEIKLWSLTEKRLFNTRPCSSSQIKLGIHVDDFDLETDTNRVLYVDK